jgi:hypothetical protein
MTPGSNVGYGEAGAAVPDRVSERRNLSAERTVGCPFRVRWHSAKRLTRDRTGWSGHPGIEASGSIWHVGDASSRDGYAELGGNVRHVHARAVGAGSSYSSRVRRIGPAGATEISRLSALVCRQQAIAASVPGWDTPHWWRARSLCRHCRACRYRSSSGIRPVCTAHGFPGLGLRLRPGTYPPSGTYNWSSSRCA